MNPAGKMTMGMTFALVVFFLVSSCLGCASPVLHTSTLDDLPAGSLQATASGSAPPLIHSQTDVVVLIHGLFRSRRSLHTLHARLEESGFKAVDYSYRSTQAEVATHGKDLFEKLKELENDPRVGRIHIVTHSMGGIVTRSALTHGRPKKLGRIVMLAPPNRGAPAASRWAPWVGGLVKPLADLEDLTTAGNDLLRTPAPDGVEVGIIAGSRDRTVPAANTHLDGQTDHIVVKSGHTFIMYKDVVKEQIVIFLKSGRFQHTEPPGDTR